MSITEAVRQRVRETFSNRCAYCLSAQRFVLGPLEIDHIIPVAEDGTDDEDNLCLACRLCNSYKGVQSQAIDPESEQKTTLFNPRKDKWSDHFQWSNGGTEIIGLTPCGRATVIALQLNNQYTKTTRRWWVSAGWHPPSEE